jgi:hypothetical protein
MAEVQLTDRPGLHTDNPLSGSMPSGLVKFADDHLTKDKPDVSKLVKDLNDDKPEIRKNAFEKLCAKTIWAKEEIQSLCSILANGTLEAGQSARTIYLRFCDKKITEYFNPKNPDSIGSYDRLFNPQAEKEMRKAIPHAPFRQLSPEKAAQAMGYFETWDLGQKDFSAFKQKLIKMGIYAEGLEKVEGVNFGTVEFLSKYAHTITNISDPLKEFRNTFIKEVENLLAHNFEHKGVALDGDSAYRIRYALTEKNLNILKPDFQIADQKRTSYQITADLINEINKSHPDRILIENLKFLIKFSRMAFDGDKGSEADQIKDRILEKSLQFALKGRAGLKDFQTISGLLPELHDLVGPDGVRVKTTLLKEGHKIEEKAPLRILPGNEKFPDKLLNQAIGEPGSITPDQEVKIEKFKAYVQLVKDLNDATSLGYNDSRLFLNKAARWSEDESQAKNFYEASDFAYQLYNKFHGSPQYLQHPVPGRNLEETDPQVALRNFLDRHRGQ